LSRIEVQYRPGAGQEVFGGSGATVQVLLHCPRAAVHQHATGRPSRRVHLRNGPLRDECGPVGGVCDLGRGQVQVESDKLSSGSRTRGRSRCDGSSSLDGFQQGIDRELGAESGSVEHLTQRLGRGAALRIG
jgi:hypothetical protein